MMEQLTNEQIDATVRMIETQHRWNHINKEAADAALAVCAQAKASNIADPILTRLDLIGELTSPEYISRLRGVMGRGDGEVVEPVAAMRVMKACKQHEGIPFVTTTTVHQMQTYCPHCEASPATDRSDAR